MLPDGSTLAGVTGVNGQYQFTNVPVIAGTYKLQEDLNGLYCTGITTTGPFVTPTIDLVKGSVTFGLTTDATYMVAFTNYGYWTGT